MGGASAVLTLSSFWGKAGDGESVHPAICHMIDVGAVTGTFLSSCAPRSLVALLAEPFGGCAEVAVRVLPLLAAMHDVGKISPGFQRKRPDLAAPLAASGLAFSESDTTDHGEVAFVFLKKVGLPDLGITAPGARFRVAATLAAHHGSFPRDAAVGGGGEAWEAHRKLAVTELARLFGFDTEDLAGFAAPSNAWCMAFAGLVSVCDWIGSSDEHFPYAGSDPGDLVAYRGRADDQARRALELLGWTGWRAEGDPRSSTQLPPRKPRLLRPSPTGGRVTSQGQNGSEDGNGDGFRRERR